LFNLTQIVIMEPIIEKKAMNIARDKGKRTYRRMVVKFGTSLLTAGSPRLNQETIANLVAQVARLHTQGREVVIVTSGAIAAGRDKLGATRKRRDIPFKQVMASVGQNHLMYTYEQLFSRHNITVAQALLTKTDLADRAGYLNARNTLLALLELRAICIVNENDVVAIEEIEGTRFGDNDNLSAMVANLIDADLLMILTDIGGLYNADPHRNPDARLIPEVKRINRDIEQMAATTNSSLGTGGMATKIEAARLATASGTTMVIADGREPDVIARLAAGEAIGTRFLPITGKLESRKRWMLCGLSTMGKLVIDSGAAIALKKQKRSLLAAGIKHSEGMFDRGDIVDIYDTEDNYLGCGITNYSGHSIDIIKGTRSGKIGALLGFDYGPEVVHRNNLALV